MTKSIHRHEMTIAPVFMSAGDSESWTAFDLARLSPDQIVGAYSLVARRPAAEILRKPSRPHRGHSGFGLFFPK